MRAVAITTRMMADTIHQATADLTNQTTDLAAFCTTARSALSKLQGLAGESACATEAEITRLNHIFQAASKLESDLKPKLDKEKVDLKFAESRLDDKRREVESRSSEVDAQKAEIRGLDEQIAREKQRQSNAVYDLIPFHGIFSAIISGDGKRAIPYYSQIDGIISAVENSKRGAEERLGRANDQLRQIQSEKHQAEAAVKTHRAEVAHLKKAVDDGHKKIEEYGQLIKTTGQQLTSTRTFQEELKSLEAACERMRSSVSVVWLMRRSTGTPAQTFIERFRGLNNFTKMLT